MNAEIPLWKLISRRQLASLLAQFAPLLDTDGDYSLLVYDARRTLLARFPPLPDEPESCPTLDPTTTTVEMIIQPRSQSEPIGRIVVRGASITPSTAQSFLLALRATLEALATAAMETRSVSAEVLNRYRELNLLYRVGETLTACLDVDELVSLTLKQAVEIVPARYGAVLLYDAGEEDALTVAACVPASDMDTSAVFLSELPGGYRLAQEVAGSGKPQILNQSPSIASEHFIPLLAVPLATAERCLGAILLAGKVRAPRSAAPFSNFATDFTANDEKLLVTLAWQAAIALENAYLFQDIQTQRDEIGAMKRYMDDIFSSVASGIITTDINGYITTLNQAAERILGLISASAVGKPYHVILAFFQHTVLPSLIEQVLQGGQSQTGTRIRLRLPSGKPKCLTTSVTALQNEQGDTIGATVVLEDITERERYERERAVLRRYLPEGLVERIPDAAPDVGRWEDRRLITVAFADIRGFTSFSEISPPERVIEVLNNYLALAEAAVRFNRGIVDKYMGDAILALFNTPLLEENDHAWWAVKMAWSLKQAVAAYHQYIAPDERLSMGIGVCTGTVIVGNVGTEKRQEYTAVGDTVNLAKRLQEYAQPGQILISQETWLHVRRRVQVNPLPAIRVKGRQAFTRIYEVIAVIDG